MLYFYTALKKKIKNAVISITHTQEYNQLFVKGIDPLNLPRYQPCSRESEITRHHTQQKLFKTDVSVNHSQVFGLKYILFIQFLIMENIKSVYCDVLHWNSLTSSDNAFLFVTSKIVNYCKLVKFVTSKIHTVVYKTKS